MKSDEIIAVFDERFKKLRKRYRGLSKNFKLEQIHDFRLQMKKLRAFIRLINTGIPAEKQIKIIKKIKSFYDITGEIRNLQLHQQRVRDTCEDLFLDKPALYLQLLRKEEVKQKKKAKRVAGRLLFGQFRHRVNGSVTGELTAASARDFVAGKIDQLQKLIALPVHYDEALHEIRKIIKDILYDQAYINSYLPPYFINKKKPEDLALKLGDFHDLCVALHLFTPAYIDQIISEAEKMDLIVLIRELEHKKKEMKEGITGMLHYVRSEIENVPFETDGIHNSK